MMKDEPSDSNKMEVDEDYQELYAKNKANMPLKTIEVGLSAASKTTLYFVYRKNGN